MGDVIDESNNHVIYDEANGAENSETEANIDEESSVVGENTVEAPNSNMTEVTSELVTQEPPDVETMLEQTTTEERHECNEAAVKGPNGEVGRDLERRCPQQRRQSNENIGGRQENFTRDVSRLCPKTMLVLIFCNRDKAAAYLKNGKYDEAFGILNQKYLLGPDIREASFLLQYCTCLLATGNRQRIEEVKQKLVEIIKNKIKPATKEVLSIAHKLRKNKEYLSAVLLFELCYEMFFDASDSYAAMLLIEKCMAGMKHTISDAMEEQDTFKFFTQHIFLPKLREMKRVLLSIEGVSDEYKCVKAGWVTHSIEICEPDTNARIAVLNEAIEAMQVYLPDPCKYQIYGTLLNNVGTLYLVKNLVAKAVDCYQKAIECFQKADDYQGDEKRKQDIKKSQSALSKATGQSSGDNGIDKGESDLVLNALQDCRQM